LKKESLAVVGFAVLVVGLWLWLEFRPHPPPPAAPLPASLPPGWNALARGLDGWRELDWADIPPTAAAMGEQTIRRERFLRESATGDHPLPVVYLRGLILLAQNDSAAACGEFLRLPADEIPAAFLYAPWRVVLQEQPESPNPFAAPLLATVAAGEVSPLIAARVRAFTGDHLGALTNYLATDPADWTGFDLRCFRLLLEEEATAADAQFLIAGAWRGGRVPEGLRPALAAMIVSPGEPDPQALAQGLEQVLTANPDLLEEAVAGLASLQEDRRLFLREDYRSLLERHAGGDLPVIDETLLLLVLAAAEEQDATSWGRWSQELSARFPQPEVTAWLQTLAPTNR
jgi:hypothetical protein